MDSETGVLKKRKLPKLMACMTKASLENLRSRALFNLDMLDAKLLRRRKLPLHTCLILELREAGYTESSNYLQDLIYDNTQLLEADEIGLLTDLRKKPDYLEHISVGLQKAERQKDREDTKKECLQVLALALYYANKEKGITWLAEKFFLVSIAVSSRYLIDGGRQKGCCKYHYAKFLLDKFPALDTEEPFEILTEVRDSSTGRNWPLYEEDEVNAPQETLFAAAAIQLFRVLLINARMVRAEDPAKAETLCRLAERRAIDAKASDKIAEAIVEIGISQFVMKNLNNALKTFERAYKIHMETNNIEGLCEANMHLAAVMQRLGDHEHAAKMLTDMGSLAMTHGLRRQLGRALHLLGELHLRRERPELGTMHLREAFNCFMGFEWEKMVTMQNELNKKEEQNETYPNGNSSLQILYKETETEPYVEEAEQSRLMSAISAGQEKMASYFKTLRTSGNCDIARVKIIKWKLFAVGWWNYAYEHEFIPCYCPIHNRSPLQALKNQQEYLKAKEELQGDKNLERSMTVHDLRTLSNSTYEEKLMNVI